MISEKYIMSISGREKTYDHKTIEHEEFLAYPVESSQQIMYFGTITIVWSIFCSSSSENCITLNFLRKRPKRWSECFLFGVFIRLSIPRRMLG